MSQLAYLEDDFYLKKRLSDIKKLSLQNLYESFTPPIR